MGGNGVLRHCLNRKKKAHSSNVSINEEIMGSLDNFLLGGNSPRPRLIYAYISGTPMKIKTQSPAMGYSLHMRGEEG